jgi:hypothetical protein
LRAAFVHGHDRAVPSFANPPSVKVSAAGGAMTLDRGRGRVDDLLLARFHTKADRFFL